MPWACAPADMASAMAPMDMAPTNMMYRFMCISDFGVKVCNNAPDRHAFLMIEAFGEGQRLNSSGWKFL